MQVDYINILNLRIVQFKQGALAQEIIVMKNEVDKQGPQQVLQPLNPSTTQQTRQQMQQLQHMFLQQNIQSHHNRCESGSTGYSYSNNQEWAEQLEEEKSDNMPTALNEIVVPQAKANQSLNKPQQSALAQVQKKKDAKKAKKVQFINVTTDEEESQEEDVVAESPDLNSGHEENKSNSGSNQQSEDDPGMLDSGGGTMINHSVVIGGDTEPDSPALDYLQALQSVKLDQSRQRQRELFENDKQQISGECVLESAENDGGSGSELQKRLMTNNFMKMTQEEEKVLENQILGIRDKIRRGELLSCQIAQQQEAASRNSSRRSSQRSTDQYGRKSQASNERSPSDKDRDYQYGNGGAEMRIQEYTTSPDHLINCGASENVMSSGFTDFRVQKVFPKMPQRETGDKELKVVGVDGSNKSHKTTPAGILKHISRFYSKQKNTDKGSNTASEISSDRNGGVVGIDHKSHENLLFQFRKEHCEASNISQRLKTENSDSVESNQRNLNHLKLLQKGMRQPAFPYERRQFANRSIHQSVTYSPVSNCITTDALNIFEKKKQRMQKIKQLRGINSQSGVAISAEFISEAKPEDKNVTGNVIIKHSDMFIMMDQTAGNESSNHNIQNPLLNSQNTNEASAEETQVKNVNSNEKPAPSSTTKAKKVYPTSQPSTPRKVAIESITFKNDGQNPFKNNERRNQAAKTKNENQAQHKMIENPNFVIIDDKNLDTGNKLVQKKKMSLKDKALIAPACTAQGVTNDNSQINSSQKKGKIPRMNHGTRSNSGPRSAKQSKHAIGKNENSSERKNKDQQPQTLISHQVNLSKLNSASSKTSITNGLVGIAPGQNQNQQHQTQHSVAGPKATKKLSTANKSSKGYQDGATKGNSKRTERTSYLNSNANAQQFLQNPGAQNNQQSQAHGGQPFVQGKLKVGLQKHPIRSNRANCQSLQVQPQMFQGSSLHSQNVSAFINAANVAAAGSNLSSVQAIQQMQQHLFQHQNNQQKERFKSNNNYNSLQNTCKGPEKAATQGLTTQSSSGNTNFNQAQTQQKTNLLAAQNKSNAGTGVANQAQVALVDEILAGQLFMSANIQTQKPMQQKRKTASKQQGKPQSTKQSVQYQQKVYCNPTGKMSTERNGTSNKQRSASTSVNGPNNPLSQMVFNQYGNNPPPTLSLNTNHQYLPKQQCNVTPNSTTNTAFNSLAKLDKGQQKAQNNSSKPAKQTNNSLESKRSGNPAAVTVFEDKDAQIKQQAQLIMILKSITQADLAFENLSASIKPAGQKKDQQFTSQADQDSATCEVDVEKLKEFTQQYKQLTSLLKKTYCAAGSAPSQTLTLSKQKSNQLSRQQYNTASQASIHTANTINQQHQNQ